MNDSNQRIAGIEAADAEVELSAEDLLGLSAPCVRNERPNVTTTQSQASVPTAPSNMAAVLSAPVQHRTPAWRMALSFAVVAGAVGAVYLALAPVKQAVQNVRSPQAQSPATTAQTEGKPGAGAPVLFANPFDAKEVFEFPAGTSETEARDAVAEILMERAMERQRKFDARVSSNR